MVVDNDDSFQQNAGLTTRRVEEIIRGISFIVGKEVYWIFHSFLRNFFRCFN